MNRENWKTEAREFYLKQNGYGYYWPCLKVKSQGPHGPCFCEINIRDSGPFKTEAGAVKYINKIIAKYYSK